MNMLNAPMIVALVAALTVGGLIIASMMFAGSLLGLI